MKSLIGEGGCMLTAAGVTGGHESGPAGPGLEVAGTPGLEPRSPSRRGPCVARSPSHESLSLVLVALCKPGSEPGLHSLSAGVPRCFRDAQDICVRSVYPSQIFLNSDSGLFRDSPPETVSVTRKTSASGQPAPASHGPVRVWTVYPTFLNVCPQTCIPAML